MNDTEVYREWIAKKMGVPESLVHPSRPKVICNHDLEDAVGYALKTYPTTVEWDYYNKQKENETMKVFEYILVAKNMDGEIVKIEGGVGFVLGKNGSDARDRAVLACAEHIKKVTFWDVLVRPFV